MKRLAISLATLCLVLTLSVPVLAAAPNPPIKLTKLGVESYSVLRLDKYPTRYGVVEYMPQDSVYVSVTAVMEPAWTDKLKKVTVKKEEASLTVGGKAVPQVGYLPYAGKFSTSIRNIYANRPNKWPEEKNPVIYNGVFAVPKDAKNASFKILDMQQDIDIPDAQAEAPTPAANVKFEVLETSKVTELPREVRLGKEKYKTTISNSGGPILAAKLRITPSAGNAVDKPHLFFYGTDWLGVVYDNGASAPCLGELRSKGLITSHVSHNNNQYNGKFKVDEITFYFAAPTAYKSFKLLFLNVPVAEGK